MTTMPPKMSFLEAVTVPGAAPEPVSLLVATCLMLFGIVVHFVQKLAELEDAGQHYTPLGYLRIHPWRAAALVLTAWALLWVCHEMGELTKVTSLLIGYSCQAAADTLRARANARLSK